MSPTWSPRSSASHRARSGNTLTLTQSSASYPQGLGAATSGPARRGPSVYSVGPPPRCSETRQAPGLLTDELVGSTTSQQVRRSRVRVSPRTALFGSSRGGSALELPRRLPGGRELACASLSIEERSQLSPPTATPSVLPTPGQRSVRLRVLPARRVLVRRSRSAARSIIGRQSSSSVRNASTASA